MKVLIIQNKFIGDVLIASVIAQNIKKIYPEAHVHFFCYSNSVAVLEGNKAIDKIISMSEKELKKINNLFKIIYQIKQEQYDIIFDPYDKLQSKLICLFSGAKQTIGCTKKKSSIFYTHISPTIDEDAIMYPCVAINDRINLLRLIRDDMDWDYKPKIGLSNEEIDEGKEIIVKETGFFIDNPIFMVGLLGSSKLKTYPIEYMIELLNSILNQYESIQLIFNYSPSQKEEALSIYSSINKKSRVYPYLVGKNLRDFIKVLANCKGLLANEGGAVHIAKAIDLPNFTIFSPFIYRNGWACFDDGDKNKSVHLMDYHPELYKNKDRRRDIEPNSIQLYQTLMPQLIIPSLYSFLDKYTVSPYKYHNPFS